MNNQIAIIENINNAFKTVKRPEKFHHSDGHCYDCFEAEEVLKDFTPETLDFETVGNLGFDPIFGISKDGFQYFIPGLVRILSERKEDYLDQFLFQFDTELIAEFSCEQKKVLLDFLYFIRDEMSESVKAIRTGTSELEQIINKLRVLNS